jgi:septal ring factor EnvC (AmiA/AmiB activator)
MAGTAHLDQLAGTMNAQLTGPDQAATLRHRIEALKAEIAQAEAKIPRTVEAIRTRKQTLARLEARLAIEGDPHPARTSNE